MARTLDHRCASGNNGGATAATKEAGTATGGRDSLGCPWLVAAVACVAIWTVPARADPVVQGLAVATAVVVAADLLVDAPLVDDIDRVLLQVGRFDVVKNKAPATEFELQYRFGAAVLWQLRPFVGAGASSDASVYAYAGLRLDTEWQRVVVTPSFALAGYYRGNGKDLGSPPLLGRFGFDIQYRLDDDVRLGVSFFHMSNGKAFGQQSNPGAEVAGLTLAWRLR
jgi:hypothetical protein